MKKIVTLAMMLVMLFSVPVTVEAAKSPTGKPVTESGTTVVTSPKTGESDLVLYGLGAAAAAFASGAVVIRKKVM